MVLLQHPDRVLQDRVFSLDQMVWLEDYARRSGVPFINLVPDFNRLTPAEIARMFRPDLVVQPLRSGPD